MVQHPYPPSTLHSHCFLQPLKLPPPLLHQIHHDPSVPPKQLPHILPRRIQRLTRLRKMRYGPRIVLPTHNFRMYRLQRFGMGRKHVQKQGKRDRPRLIIVPSSHRRMSRIEVLDGVIDIPHTRFGEVKKESSESAMQVGHRPDGVREDVEESVGLFGEDCDFPGHRCCQWAKRMLAHPDSDPRRPASALTLGLPARR